MAAIKKTKAPVVTGDKPKIEELDISVGNIEKHVGPAYTTKTSGVKVRGTGAATKGLMARGPMA